MLIYIDSESGKEFKNPPETTKVAGYRVQLVARDVDGKILAGAASIKGQGTGHDNEDAIILAELDSSFPDIKEADPTIHLAVNELQLKASDYHHCGASIAFGVVDEDDLKLANLGDCGVFVGSRQINSQHDAREGGPEHKRIFDAGFEIPFYEPKAKTRKIKSVPDGSGAKGLSLATTGNLASNRCRPYGLRHLVEITHTKLPGLRIFITDGGQYLVREKMHELISVFITNHVDWTTDELAHHLAAEARAMYLEASGEIYADDVTVLIFAELSDKKRKLLVGVVDLNGDIEEKAQTTVLMDLILASLPLLMNYYGKLWLRLLPYPQIREKIAVLLQEIKTAEIDLGFWGRAQTLKILLRDTLRHIELQLRPTSGKDKSVLPKCFADEFNRAEHEYYAALIPAEIERLAKSEVFNCFATCLQTLAKAAEAKGEQQEKLTALVRLLAELTQQNIRLVNDKLVVVGCLGKFARDFRELIKQNLSDDLLRNIQDFVFPTFLNMELTKFERAKSAEIKALAQLLRQLLPAGMELVLELLYRCHRHIDTDVSTDCISAPRQLAQDCCGLILAAADKVKLQAPLHNLVIHIYKMTARSKAEIMEDFGADVRDLITAAKDISLSHENLSGFLQTFRRNLNLPLVALPPPGRSAHWESQLFWINWELIRFRQETMPPSLRVLGENLAGLVRQRAEESKSAAPMLKREVSKTTIARTFVLPDPISPNGLLQRLLAIICKVIDKDGVIPRSDRVRCYNCCMQLLLRGCNNSCIEGEVIADIAESVCALTGSPPFIDYVVKHKPTLLSIMGDFPETEVKAGAITTKTLLWWLQHNSLHKVKAPLLQGCGLCKSRSANVASDLPLGFDHSKRMCSSFSATLEPRKSTVSPLPTDHLVRSPAFSTVMPVAVR